MVRKIAFNTKVIEIENKVNSTSVLVINVKLNTKAIETENKKPRFTKLVTTAAHDTNRTE